MGFFDIGRWAAAVRVAGVALCVAWLGAGAPATAQGMQEVRELPADCRDMLPSRRSEGVQPWQNFVRMEHCDRIKRLQRLSVMLPPEQQPRFFEGVVPADRLPSGFDTDMPVLRVVFPERTFFDTDTASLRFEAMQISAIIAESLRREPPDVAMFVAGHADARGDRAHNERLSIDRSNAIVLQILRQGVNFSSLWRVGFGEDMPLVAGADAFAWDRNRRVEFLFAAKPDAVATWLADQQLDGLCQARTSIDVARCKQRLDLRKDYEALELRLPPRTAIEPTRSPTTSVQPSGRALRAVAPARAAATQVSPSRTASAQISPLGGRKFQIDPLSRRAEPKRVDL